MKTPQQRRQIDLYARIQEPFETGALLLAAMAHPQRAEEHMILEVRDAWCAEQIRATVAADPSKEADLRARWPMYCGLDGRTARRRLLQSSRRLRDRQVAARMARAFLKEAMTGEPADLVLDMKRISLNELSLLVLKDSGQSDPENVEKRVWRESIPVIHLAAAMDQFANVEPGTNGISFNIQDLDVHRRWVARASELESAVLGHSAFGAGRRDLIHFNWIE